MVIDEDGPRCQGHCPNYGCLEAFVSGTAIGREARSPPTRSPTRRSAVRGARRGDHRRARHELALDGDELSRMVLGHVGRMLGVGLANIVNIFNPEVIVVGGGAMAAGDLLLEPARTEMRARALEPGRDLVASCSAKFGPEAGMLGAGVLALDELG